MAAHAFRSPANDRTTPCEGCGAPTATTDLSFAPDGRQICRRCAANVSVAQANARAAFAFGTWLRDLVH